MSEEKEIVDDGDGDGDDDGSVMVKIDNTC